MDYEAATALGWYAFLVGAWTGAVIVGSNRACLLVVLGESRKHSVSARI